MPIIADPLLATTADFLRFVTEFFEVVSQSAPHIYHSALQLAPWASAVRKLYSQHIYSAVESIVNGIPASWDSCTASTVVPVCCAVWSPCGQFIAAAVGGTVETYSSITLERVSVLKHPSSANGVIECLAFSPDGHLVVGLYG